MNKEKAIKEFDNRFETGYYNEHNQFILHSFDDKPAIIWNIGTQEWYRDGLRHRDYDLPAYIWYDGAKFWYVDHKEYWFIDNKRYDTLDKVYEKYKDKIIIVDVDISQNLTDNGIDFFYLDPSENDNYTFSFSFLILNDSDRNEVILKYG